MGPRERPAQLKVEEEEPRSGPRGRPSGSGTSRSRPRPPPGRTTRESVWEFAPRRAAPEPERGEAVEVRAGPRVRRRDERVPLREARHPRREDPEGARREPAPAGGHEPLGRQAPRFPLRPAAPDPVEARRPAPVGQLDGVPLEEVGPRAQVAPRLERLRRQDEGRVGVVPLVEPGGSPSPASGRRRGRCRWPGRCASARRGRCRGGPGSLQLLAAQLFSLHVFRPRPRRMRLSKVVTIATTLFSEIARSLRNSFASPRRWRGAGFRLPPGRARSRPRPTARARGRRDRRGGGRPRG